MKRTLLAAALCCTLPVLATPGRSTQEIIDTAPADAWRTPDPANLLYMQLDKGTVVFELAPDFAPEHVAQIKLLAQQHFWDGLSVYRVQDNYVAQFGDPDAEDKAKAKSLPPESKALPAEFTRPLAGLAFTALPDKDGWAKQVGFTDGFAVANDDKDAWLTHCYGVLGSGRNDPPDSSNGAELYVVIGQSPLRLRRDSTISAKAGLSVFMICSARRSLSGTSLPRRIFLIGVYSAGLL